MKVDLCHHCFAMESPWGIEKDELLLLSGSTLEPPLLAGAASYLDPNGELLNDALNVSNRCLAVARVHSMH